ncbi:MAG: SDR family oxidoreductase [Spirochaetia bacterium]|jgi:NAD(P)-dependent dehydrogenase (short-subunit alcohol dehydrogenase family)
MNLDQLFDVRGKTAVITGGAGALPGTLAEALASLGVRVALLDLNGQSAEARAKTIRQAGGEAQAFGCSVLDADELETTRAKVGELWGVPDYLVNGAGGNSPKASTTQEFLETSDVDRADQLGFFNMSLDDFQAVFELNFTGTLLPTRVFASGMVRRGSGSILNIASMAAVTPLTKVMAYSTAKAAVANFTKWLAVHLSHTGVRVNALAPGFFMTEQLRFLHIDQKTGQYTPRAQKTVAHTPMGRYGEPAELVGTAVWLLSSASRFVTGDVVPIDGGYSSYTI